MANRELGHLDPAQWEGQAACTGVNTELYFPPRQPPGLYKKYKDEATSYCNGIKGRKPCPVRTECLEWAIFTDEQFGIFGGMSHRKRNAFDRKRKRLAAAAAVGTPSGNHPPQAV